MRYQGKLILEIGWEGISFPHEGDEILWYWPWVRPSFKYEGISETYKYKSLNLDQEFTDFEKYEFAVDKNSIKGKVEGFVFTDLLYSWMKVKLRHGHFVVLYDINVSSKSTSFWTRIPSRYQKELVKDVVILRCKDKREVIHLCQSIEENFATAIGVSNGDLIAFNKGVA